MLGYEICGLTQLLDLSDYFLIMSFNLLLYLLYFKLELISYISLLLEPVVDRWIDRYIPSHTHICVCVCIAFYSIQVFLH